MITRLKKALAILSLTGITLTSGYSAVLAQSATNSGQLNRAANQQQRISNLQTKADMEINRRLSSLNNALSRLNNSQKLTAADKATLTGLIQTDITNLTALKAKIDADTDLPTLRTDVQSIVKDYRIYALIMPKGGIAVAADRVLSYADKLTALSTKLQNITLKLQAQGKDTSAIQSSITDLNAQIKDAQTQAQAAHDTVMSLTPDGYPGNKATLQTAIADLKTARNDLQKGRLDIQAAVAAIKTLRGQNPGSLATPSATPVTVTQ